jgi:wyosine [tRNA(Phe)-imidazoG37] synthetase (radical SAM superfamily)
MLLSLKEGILYGPVYSRRLGRSLGINLAPARYKLCSFNCVYCHYGWTAKHTMYQEEYFHDMPSLDDVVEALEQAARSSVPFEHITFSGNGEPTLYPWFAELVDEVIRIRDRHRFLTKIALLSNSTGLVNAKVRAVIPRIDYPMFKLDAGGREAFLKMNKPAEGVDYDTILDCLSALENIYIQSVFLDGEPSNIGEEDLMAFFHQLRRIRPLEVHIYSIDRPVPNRLTRLVLPQDLEAIAARGRRETGVSFKAFYPRKNNR